MPSKDSKTSLLCYRIVAERTLGKLEPFGAWSRAGIFRMVNKAEDAANKLTIAMNELDLSLKKSRNDLRIRSSNFPTSRQFL